MQNILIIGDVFIPSRAARIPPALKAKLQPEHIDAVVSPGSLTSKYVHEYLKTLSSDITIAKGPLDDLQLPEVAQRGGDVKIAALHGYQVVPQSDPFQLVKYSKLLNVDVIVASGELMVKEESGVVVIRPGSLTGVYGNPSFVLLQINKKEVKVYTYILQENEVKIQQYQIQREFQYVEKDVSEESGSEVKTKSKKVQKRAQKQESESGESESTSSIVLKKKTKKTLSNSESNSQIQDENVEEDSD